MPQIRCTQCGAVNDTGAPDYPFCVGCQDNLAKCGSCQWFDDQLAACTQPGVAGLFDISAGATPPCQYHAFRPPLTLRSRSVWAVVAVGFAAALFTLAYALLQLREPAPPQPPPRPEVKVNLNTGALALPVGVPRTVECDVYNPSHVGAKDVRLLIGKDFFANFDMGKAPGEAGGWRQERGALVFGLATVAPGARHVVPLTLVPKRAGKFQLVIRVESPRNAFLGQLVSLIEVAAAPETTRGREVKP